MVEFVALHKDLQTSDSEWPAMNADNEYWVKADEFVKQACGKSRGSKYMYQKYYYLVNDP